MKSTMGIIGIIFMILGIAIIAYQGVTYTQHEKIAQVGDIQVTADTQKTIYFPPILGGLSLVVGLALVVISRNK